MPNQVRALRSSTSQARPAGRLPGELYVNFADNQLGVISASNTALDLLAVRNFSVLANYLASDYVIYQGILYRALSASNPGNFIPANWSAIGGSVTVSDTAPASPQAGQLWFDSVGGQLYVYYNDGNTSQWVIAVNQATPDLSGLLPKSGGTMTGPLILAADPTGPLQAATKEYVDAGNATVLAAANTKLPLTGGSLSGSLSVTGSLSVSGDVTVVGTTHAQTSSFGTTDFIAFTGGAGVDRYLQGFPGYYLHWSTSSGNLQFVGNNAQLGIWDYAGNLTVTSNINAGGNIICPNTVQGAYLYSTGAVQAGTYVNANSSMSAGTSLSAGTYVLASSGPLYPSYGNWSGFMVGNIGGLPGTQYSGSWYDAWRTSDGMRFFQSPVGSVHQFDGSGNYTINGNGFKPGGGAWAASSDSRIKDVIGNYNLGLDDVLKLRPVIYTYKGNDTLTEELDMPIQVEDDGETLKAKRLFETGPYPASQHCQVAETKKPHVGLIAQEVETIFPNMVTQREGYIDGQKVTDFRTLDTTELIFALVNSVKTLAARIAELEAAR
jgi:hypothetical protein